ncbi:MAG: amidohydrolase, partial [Mesorhizobium sp.]
GLTLVGENPETNFILTHAGMLTDMSEESTQAWKAGLRTLSAAPNLYAKLSGLGTFVHRNDPTLIAYIV